MQNSKIDKNKFIKETKKSGYNLNTGFNKIGFVLKDLSAGQIPYICINECNKWLDNNFGTNLTIFCYDHAIPCVPMKFAKYHVKELDFFVGDLIATSIDSTLLINNNTRAKRYYYINDFDWTRPSCNLSKENISKVLYNNNIIKFCRCKDHRDKLKKDGINILDIIVEDFNIKTILEITRNI